MKIPTTTSEQPYIDFSFNKNGKISLKATSNWWGGKNSGYLSSDGSTGNTCLPKDLDAYLKAFKARKIKEIEREILALQKKLQRAKAMYQ